MISEIGLCVLQCLHTGREIAQNVVKKYCRLRRLEADDVPSCVVSIEDAGSHDLEENCGGSKCALTVESTIHTCVVDPSACGIVSIVVKSKESDTAMYLLTQILMINTNTTQGLYKWYVVLVQELRIMQCPILPIP